MTSNRHPPHDKLLDLLLDVVCVVDKDGRFLSVSAACERVFGYRPDEMLGRTAFELMHPDDRDASRALVQRINSGQPSHDHENRYIHKDGHIVHIMWSAQWLEAEQVRVGVARDITARKRAEAMQAALYAVSEAAHAVGDLHKLYSRVHEVLGSLLPATHFSVALYDAANDQLSVAYHVDPSTPSPSPMPPSTTTAHGEVIRRAEALLLTPEAINQHALDWLGAPLISGTQTLGALVLQHYSGGVRYTEQDKALLQFVASQLAAAIERKRTHTRLEFLAQYDQLTELPNRTLFLDRLRSALQRAKRDALQLAVLYLDMDHFKQINDTFGHTTGDLLLQEVARRLRQCVRESDTVGRLGGDEFAVIVDNIGRQEDATLVAEKMIVALSAPYLLDGHRLISAPSLGIALYPGHGQTELQLVRCADEAMYVAKRSGGKRYVVAAQPLTDAD
ncbi:sensor domain-containing diguanylate cyclase [Pseudomonas sp. 8BK]|uniref:sensor domain-containing diguanylate cyclase n=1 Tax=Pseudomonas sp. 8BK TaxID=2653164 RepID=UPI00135A2D43|nr:sensor domain-containing diguanylate cyclase [Pseudomonas sp. 8BK]